ncbi:MAG: TolC family protein, partial [Geobacter sp.]
MPFKDPLNTAPDELQNGTVLPGDVKPVSCISDRDVTVPLTLDMAVDAALCNNPRLKSTWAAIKVQAGAVGEARSAYLPTASGTLTSMHSSTKYESSNHNTTREGFTLYGAATWRLFDFGARLANRKAADHLLAADLS